MTNLSLEEAQARLPDVIHRLHAGEEVIITEGDQVVAKIIGERRPVRKPRVPGSARGMLTILAEDEQPEAIESSRPGPGLCKGIITYMAPDFDAPLEDMKEYTE